jgi:hypothetical protein
MAVMDIAPGVPVGAASAVWFTWVSFGIRAFQAGVKQGGHHAFRRTDPT